jgi:mannose-6-phosphate isomerase-like protein (cupin superfamily)
VSHPNIAYWDDVEEHDREEGSIHSAWRYLGEAVGTVGVGVQWELEGALPEPELPEPGERPPNVVRLEDVEPELLDRGEVGDGSRELGAAAGSVETELNHSDIPPGKLNCPAHCHASEEEVFVVLEGDGVYILGDEERPVRAGSVVARPPRTRVGRAFARAPAG